MNLRARLGEQLVTEEIGEEIFALATKIFPICRSITGNGVRQTLREIGAHVGAQVGDGGGPTYKKADVSMPRSIGPSPMGFVRICGIVGILGREPVAGALVDALRRLEYRG